MAVSLFPDIAISKSVPFENETDFQNIRKNRDPVKNVC